MFLFEVKRLLWSALEIEFFELYFLLSELGGHPVSSRHLAIPRGWPLNTGSTVRTLNGIVTPASSTDFSKAFSRLSGEH